MFQWKFLFLETKIETEMLILFGVKRAIPLKNLLLNCDFNLNFLLFPYKVYARRD